ncbi:MAG TPA: alpha-amylase family glycosyl hydrolase [Steroidobacteraceae bacterium]|nr:alpha-amylase family glycosyl hydrolase [Steroidobacteraceae bacterium]
MAPELGPVPDTVFYEIFVRSFADSTTGPLANDGIGDFNGLIEKLDYLNDGDPATTSDLGITGIWLMPINPSPSYHGYDVTDYYDVNPEYGTKEDFRRFMREAHRRGIRVIVDLVLNHSSSDHSYFRKALAGDPRYRSWYVFVDEPPRPIWLGPWGQTVWQEMQGQHYYGIFWSGMPDLDYRNPEVTAEARRIADFWLNEMGVDGFRLDAIRHLIEDGREMSDTPETRAWLIEFNDALEGIRPGALTVGEIWTQTEIVSEYVAEDAVDLAFEFDLAGAFLDAAQTADKTALAYTLENVEQSYPEQRYATFLTNHDQDRIMSVLGGDVARAGLAASLLLTAPGVPFIYYGEEIGLTGRKPDERIRTPMPWTAATHGGFTDAAARPWEPLEPGHETRNVAAQTAREDSLLSLYRRLVHLRNAHPALRGDFHTIETGRDDVIAWLRTAAGQELLVVANLGDEALGSDSLGRLRLPAIERELLHDAPIVEGSPAMLAPLTLYVFEAGRE